MHQLQISAELRVTFALQGQPDLHVLPDSTQLMESVAQHAQQATTVLETVQWPDANQGIINQMEDSPLVL